MSNYINVLRRLERERRSPAAPPSSAPLPTPIALRTGQSVRMPAEPVEPADSDPIAVPTVVAPPAPIPTKPRTAPATRTPAVAKPPAAAKPAAAPKLPVTPEPAPAPPLARDAVPTPRQLDTLRSRAMQSPAHPGVARLLDTIRLLDTTRRARVVVFAGASNREAVESLAVDLAHHAERGGIRAFVAQLGVAGGRSVISAVVGGSTPEPAHAVQLEVGESTNDLHAWIDAAAPGSEMAIIIAPPLATSVDAAILACACDGLVIIAESEVTERAALETAAERARLAGCRTLGIVMHGTKDRVPGWLRRIMGDGSPARSTAED